MRSRLITRPRDATHHVFLRNYVKLTQKEAEVSKNLTEFTDLKIILLNYQNNYVRLIARILQNFLRCSSCLNF